MQPLFKKKRSRPQTEASSSSSSQPAKLSRRDDEGDDSGDEAGPSVVVAKQRKLDASNPLVSSTGISLAKRNRLAAQEAAAAAKEEEDALALLQEDEYSSVTARPKASGSTTTASNRDDATRGVDWYDDEDSSKKSSTAPAKDRPNNDDGVYRGLSAYSSASASNGPITSSKTAQRGPIRGSNNIRTITVVDYQPDVCKDYKETGYCGFGDTCKFLHDRSDYLAGWQMEAAYMPNSSARILGEDDAGGADDDEEEEEIPFACLICRQPFTDPVVTRCGHYFCSGCAIKRYAKTPKCFACGAQTGGIFNSATKIIERMEKRRRGKEEERSEKRRGWGREDDDGGEGGGEILEGVEIGGSGDDDE